MRIAHFPDFKRQIIQQAIVPLSGGEGVQAFNPAFLPQLRCDLAQLPETEPMIEVVVGHRIEKADGNYTHAKNARTLKAL
jgi:hypothetical protein